MKQHLELQVNIDKPLVQFEVKKHTIRYSLVFLSFEFLEECSGNKGEWPAVRERA